MGVGIIWNLSDFCMRFHECSCASTPLTDIHIYLRLFKFWGHVRVCQSIDAYRVVSLHSSASDPKQVNVSFWENSHMDGNA